jgi:hypothetical protein
MSRPLTPAEILLILEGDISDVDDCELNDLSEEEADYGRVVDESLVDRRIHGGNGCSVLIEVHNSDSSKDETDNNMPLNVQLQQVHESKQSAQVSIN